MSPRPLNLHKSVSQIMKRRTIILHLTTTLFGLCAALFFIPSVELHCKICLPTLTLALGLFIAGERQLLPIACGLLCSTAGDAAGYAGLFIEQAAAFAAAHVCYISYLIKETTWRPRAYSLTMAIIMLTAICFIAVHAPLSAERITVIIYGIIITGMLYAALQYTGKQKKAFATAALLFVCSDLLIAWTRFVEQFAGQTLFIMTTYYAAQYLFFHSALHTPPAMPREAKNAKW